MPGDVFQLAITLPDEGGRVIGSCGVRISERTLREGNIGYEVVPASWVRGYATEAARAVLDYGFDQLGLPSHLGAVQRGQHRLGPRAGEAGHAA